MCDISSSSLWFPNISVCLCVYTIVHMINMQTWNINGYRSASDAATQFIWLLLVSIFSTFFLVFLATVQLFSVPKLIYLFYSDQPKSKKMILWAYGKVFSRLPNRNISFRGWLELNILRMPWVIAICIECILSNVA